MRPHNICTLFLLILAHANVWAQDPQFSQYYAAPLYLNPAFAGSTECTRFVSNYRNQWYGLSAPFRTFAFSADHALTKIKSGIGLLVVSDQAGSAGLIGTEVGVTYAYRVDLSQKWAMRAGGQGSYVSKSVNLATLTFPDQFSQAGQTGNATTDLAGSSPAIHYFDATFGGLVYSKSIWLGLSAHHLTRPSQRFLSSNSRLPIKYSVHGGYKIIFNTDKNGLHTPDNLEKSITPTFLLKSQGQFLQLDLGAYFTYEPFFAGLWYRGVPFFERTKGSLLQDAVIVQIGFRYKMLNAGYSYDYTISRLGSYAKGSHELALGYLICFNQYRQPKGPRRMRLPCPQFYDGGLFK